MADKIKQLREQMGYTQAELARKLKLTRSSINGWEMGLSVPSTPMVVELAKIFNVSTDYLLGLDDGASLRVEGLSKKEVAVLVDLVSCFREKR
ncbi:MAG: helix-turn-helix transcriptional regulator [Monoglobales bacterium]